EFGDDRPLILLAVDDVTVLRRIERYERVLAEVSGEITTALDTDTLMDSVAKLVVPALADWVILDTCDDNGTWRRTRVLHRNPDLQDDAQRLALRAFANSANP